MERTFVMLKPGVLSRRIVGELITRFERKGLKITALKLMTIDRPLCAAHYAEHQGRDFYEKLVEYTVSGPVLAFVLEGPGAIAMVRLMIGPTSGAGPGTIRGDYARQTRLNVVHASDSPESAAREIPLFFKPEEIISWDDGNDAWF
ncbi:MAG: nucleoside-diphosphate kinase [Spirochaetaceae bacterium]|jgi:nucleoside-diphosphate kinase|nr:nucleoside-diphosphate kinase [Spirochaetaceae bacterium]